MRLPRLNRDKLGEQNEQWQPGLWARIVVLLLIVAYLIAFVVQNAKSVKVDFVFGSGSLSLIWLMLIGIGIGILGGILLGQLYRRRGRKQRG
jgi:uncharacterized integral membrane protein